MTKKRLSYSLRNEVEKSSEDEGSSSQNELDNADTNKMVDASATPSAAAPAAAAKPAAKLATQKITKSQVRTGQSPTELKLQAKIAELEAELETAHQHETSLQQQIVTLKADLQQQIDLSAQLAIDLEQVKGQVENKATQLEDVTAELDEAKKVILQLSEVNDKLLAAVKPISDQPAQKPIPAKPQRISLKPLPRYCIQSEPKSTTLSDDDIGWVD